MPADANVVEAEQARGRLVWRLRKYGSPRAHRLARIIGRCTACTPCRSGACPYCGLALQRAALRLCDRVIEAPAQRLRGRMTALTIVPSCGCVAPSELTPDLCQQVAAEVMSTLRRLRLATTLLGLDISANEDLTGQQPAHWSVHIHGIMLGWLSRAQKARLRRCFPPTALVRRPVKAEPLDQRVEGRAYAFKWQRFRRQRYVAKLDYRAPHLQTRAKALRPRQAVKLALVEHRFGLKARLMTHGVNVTATQAFLADVLRARDGP